MKITLALAPVWQSVTPHLALAFLKGSLQHAGYECTTIDFSIQFRPFMVSVMGDKGAEEYISSHPRLYQGWAKQITDTKPDIVGFSILGSNLANSGLIAREVRRQLPGVMIVAGGPSMTRENLGAVQEVLTFADYVIEGEGEQALTDFVRCYEQKGDFAQLKQLWMNDAGGKAIYTGHTNLQNIDAIPYPDFTDFDRSAFPNPRKLPMLFSRGCILNCNYCENKWNHLTQRSRSGRNVFDELKHIVKTYDINEYMFNDDSLISSKTMRQLDEYADLVLAEGLAMPWNVYGTRVERLLTQPFVNKLRRSGLNRLSLGIESFSSRVQKEMGKSSRYDDADKMVRMLAGEGVAAETWIIYGYPTETDADFDETLQWFVQNPGLLRHVTANSFGPNVKYMTDRPGMVTFYGDRPGLWTSAESTMAKRKERFLALMDVLEQTRRAHRDFTFHCGDPLYVKYFNSWTARDKKFLLDSWERIEDPAGYKARHSSLFTRVLDTFGRRDKAVDMLQAAVVPTFAEKQEKKAKPVLQIGDLDTMKSDLYARIDTYLKGLPGITPDQQQQRLHDYITAIENVKVHLMDNITEDIFFALSGQGPLHLVLQDLDTHAPEYLAQRTLEFAAEFDIPQWSPATA
ncbi:MAG: B12-binding domain-containing radical SAM protein [Bacteroidetes bacterium]|nr:B12-binding domain-containing radical SAM protein [Bacteroidota bacterium]